MEGILEEPRFSLWSAKNTLNQGRFLVSQMKKQFPGTAGQEIFFGFVPGRIEVFGRHTDYAGGKSLVCAIDRGFLFSAAPNRKGLVRMREDSAEFEPVEFELSASLAPRAGHWANYPMTMARRMARNFGASGRRLRGVDIVFSSTMPVGSGMSGSSALMMMVFTALAMVNRLHTHPTFRENIHDSMDLSMYLACAENGQSFHGLDGDRGVGTFGGSEDHAAILNARQGRLSLFSFCPASLLSEIAWPRAWRLVVAFSGARAEKTREALEKYNLVSRRVYDAVDLLNQSFGTNYATLREAVDHGAGLRLKGTAWLRTLDSVPGNRAAGLADRVRQFILEDRSYLPQAVAALRERDLRAFGEILSASHRASRKYLWNIAPEIDALARSALRLGAAGASGFGAGFGGSIVAVVPAERAESFAAKWRERYIARFPGRAKEAAFFIASPGPGIQVWQESGPVRLVDLIFKRKTG